MNPAYLSLRYEQMVIQLPEVQKDCDAPDDFKKMNERTIPIEDIGVVVLDNILRESMHFCQNWVRLAF